MPDYSNSILEVMKYVDSKIVNLNPESLDKTRLQNKIRIQIVANIKRITVMDNEDALKEIDKIINTQVLQEIVRHI